MSYQTARWQSLGENSKTGVFSEGYVDNTPNLYLPDGASPYLRNVRLDGNTAVIRKGHSLLSNLISTSRGMWIGAYLRSNSANDRLVVRENAALNYGLVLYNIDWTRAQILTNTDIVSNKRMCFINVADVMYCMNGSDKFWKLSGSTYSIPANVPTDFAPAFWVVFNGCLWVSWWSTNPNIVYKSLWWIYDNDGKFIAPAYDDFTTTGSDQFTFEETITGLCANAQALFYFTKNTVSVTGQSDIETVQISNGWSRVSYTTSVLTVKEWSINHWGIVWVGNDVYYITPSNKICKIHRWSNIYGYEVQELSSRKYAGCDELMKSIDKDQSDCWGYYIPNEDIIKWFFKSKGSSVHDICVVYDVDKDKFLVDTGELYYDGTNFKGRVYALSEVEAKLYEDEVGLDDDDSPIPFEYWTKEFYISDPSFKKIFWELRTVVDINLNARLKQEIWVDERLIDTKEIKIWVDWVGWIGTFAIGTSMVWVDIEADAFQDDLDYTEAIIMRTKGNLNVRGRKIQVRFSNSEVWSKVRLKYLSCKSEVLPELTNSLT